MYLYRLVKIAVLAVCCFVLILVYGTIFAAHLGEDLHLLTPKISVMKYDRIIVAALTATAVMTAFIIVAPYVGLPKMNVGAILGSVFNSVAVGWVIHILIGLILTLPYVFFFNHWIPVENKFARGAIYGILVFVFSEIVFSGANIIGHLSQVNKEDLGLMVFDNIIACMIYGCVLGGFFERKEKDGMELAKGN